MKPPRAVLVICVRYLGDTLLLRPCLRALRAAFPDARIDALVAGGTACALDGCADANNVIEWPARKPLAAAATLAKIAVAGYDWAIDFTGNDRSAIIALASRAGFRAAYERPKLPAWSLRRAAYTFRPAHRKAKPHTLVQRLELLEACGIPSQGNVFGLAPSASATEKTGQLLAGMPEKILHAHVTSRDMQKAIPARVAKAVFEGAIRAGWGIAVSCGRDESERAHVALCTEGLHGHLCRTFGGLDWHGLVALSARCDAYWGSDTAPAHVAAALENARPLRAFARRPLAPASRGGISRRQAVRVPEKQARRLPARQTGKMPRGNRPGQRARVAGRLNGRSPAVSLSRSAPKYPKARGPRRGGCSSARPREGNFSRGKGRTSWPRAVGPAAGRAYRYRDTF